MTYNTLNYTEQGGARTVIGGSLDVVSGGDLDIESGGTFKVAGTAVTASAAELNKLASSSSVSAQASKAVIADANKKINLALIGSGAAVSVSGLLAGVGTTNNPVTTSTADSKWLEIRSQSTATTGDSRLAYLRHNINGDGGGGECIRGITDLTAAAGNANGAHVSLQVGATGYCTGMGTGLRSQLYVKNEAVHSAGYYYGAQVEVFCEGSASDISGVTKHAILNVSAIGDATGAAKVLNAVAFDGVSEAGVTKMITSSALTLATAPCSLGIAVLVNGTRGYIPVIVPSEWD